MYFNVKISRVRLSKMKSEVKIAHFSVIDEFLGVKLTSSPERDC